MDYCPIKWLNEEWGLQSIQMNTKTVRPAFARYSKQRFTDSVGGGNVQRGYVKIWRNTPEGKIVVDRALNQKSARKMIARIKEREKT